MSAKYTRQPWILYGFRNLRPKLQWHVCSILRLGIGRYGCFLKWWYPQNAPKWSFLVGKPMVAGYHHFRKHPYGLKQSHRSPNFWCVQSQLTNKFWQNKLHRLFGRFTWCKLQVKRCPKVRLRRWLGKYTSVRSRLKWWPKVSVWRLSGKVTSNGPLFWWHEKMACQTVGGEHNI